MWYRNWTTCPRLMFWQSIVWRYLWLWPVNRSKVSMRWTWRHPPPQIFMALSLRVHQSTTLLLAHCTEHTRCPPVRTHPTLSEPTSCPPSPCIRPRDTWAQRTPSMAGKTWTWDSRWRTEHSLQQKLQSVYFLCKLICIYFFLCTVSLPSLAFICTNILAMLLNLRALNAFK